MNEEKLEKARTEIEDFTDKFGETFVEAIMEYNNTSKEMAKGIIAEFCSCRSERDFEVANNMLMAACGYSFESLVERIQKRDTDGYIWESC